jgi:hypothetical protein
MSKLTMYIMLWRFSIQLVWYVNVLNVLLLNLLLLLLLMMMRRARACDVRVSCIGMQCWALT